MWLNAAVVEPIAFPKAEETADWDFQLQAAIVIERYLALDILINVIEINRIKAPDGFGKVSVVHDIAPHDDA
jgi:hypothetical protein